jgi:WD40 repeat protein
MKIHLRILGCVLMTGAALAQNRTAPVVSDMYSSARDVRKPDITIPGDARGGGGVIAYNPNGRFLAVAGGDNLIRIYDARPGDRLTADLTQTLTGHAQRVLALGFNGTNTLVSISEDHSAKSWDIVSGKLLHMTELKLGKPNYFAFSPGTEPFLAASSGNEIGLWNYQGGERLNTFEANDSEVAALAFTPDGKSLAIGTTKGVVRVMDIASWKVALAIDLDTPVHSLAASATHIVVGYGDGTLALLNMGDQTSVPELKKHTGAINAVAFSPKGERFASASEDRTVKVWDTETLKLLCSLEGHTEAVRGVAFSPDGRKMASIDVGGTVNYWTVPLPPSAADDSGKVKAMLPVMEH